MKKTILRSFVLLCLGSLFFVACQQNEELSEITQELPNDLTLQEAKAWFEQNQLAPSNARVAGEPEIFSKVFWNYSFNYKISKEASNFVVIPLTHRKPGDFLNSKQLWIYKNNKKQMTMNVVEYIFDRDVNRPDLTNSLLNFSGLMVIRDWNNNFLGGLVYKKNQVVGAVSQLGVFKGNPPASAPNTTRPNGRTALQTCVETQTCYFSYTYVPAYPQIGGYWHMDCTVDYKCYFGDLLSVPITGPIIPPGSSFTGGYTPTPGQITSYNDLNYEIVTTGLCKAFDRMYQVHLSSIDKCEVNAYIAKDGRVIILPTYLNENERGLFFGEFVDSQLRPIVLAGPNPNSPHPFITLIDYSGSTPRETNVEVTGMIHTHPCKDVYGKPISPERWDKPSMAIYNPQTGDTDGDTVIAGIYKNLVHYIVNCSNIIQFDASYNSTTNNVISKKSRSSCN